MRAPTWRLRKPGACDRNQIIFPYFYGQPTLIKNSRECPCCCDLFSIYYSRDICLCACTATPTRVICDNSSIAAMATRFTISSCSKLHLVCAYLHKVSAPQFSTWRAALLFMSHADVAATTLSGTTNCEVTPRAKDSLQQNRSTANNSSTMPSTLLTEREIFFAEVLSQMGGNDLMQICAHVNV